MERGRIAVDGGERSVLRPNWFTLGEWSVLRPKVSVRGRYYALTCLLSVRVYDTHGNVSVGPTQYGRAKWKSVVPAEYRTVIIRSASPQSYNYTSNICIFKGVSDSQY
jgi:hypothetical protein